MVVEVLARQAEVLSERTGQPFTDAFAEVLKTPAGHQLAGLADGPHRHEGAAYWQADLITERETQRPAALARPTAKGGEGPLRRERTAEGKAHLAGRRPSGL